MSRHKKDRTILEDVFKFLGKNELADKPTDQIILEIGMFFLGKPYVAGTLETKGPERLIVNLRAFDCFTFVESVVALARSIRFGEKSFEAFSRMLRHIRYRQGRLQGYSSRLHYFSDWIHDNQRKGILKNVTPELEGKPFMKTLNFMTSHLNLYSPLKHRGILSEMKTAERRISRRTLFSIPPKIFWGVEDRIHEGDIIAITTDTDGLDVQHVGLAVSLKNRIHLLHASGKKGKVILSKETLYSYLMESRTRSGVMVARMR